jgi:hypothetical protein
MKIQSQKTALQIMYETVMEKGGPQGLFSQAVVDAYEGTKQYNKQPQKIILSFKKKLAREEICRLK